MDQASLKAAYEAQHTTEAAALRRELQAKFSLIIGGAKPSKICELVNAKTGEKYYTRAKTN